MEKTIKFEPLHISPVIFFTGTDLEIEEAEEKEAQAVATVEQIIFSSDFIALEWREQSDKGDRRRILHHSTRPGIMFQLSYIDGNGVPAMHENYIKNGDLLDDRAVGGKDDLLRAITKKFLYDEGLTLRILTAETA